MVLGVAGAAMTAGGIASEDASLLAASVGVVVAAIAALVADVVLALRGPASGG